MSRGDQKIGEAPYRLWRVLVEEQHRVRLPLGEVRTVVPWLSLEPGTVDCVGTLGPVGGIQIAPATTHERLSRGFIEALGDSTARSSESSQRWMDLARYLATTWPIPISVESSRISFTLPEPIRRAQLLPGAGGTVTVFGFGEILEVWEAVKWHDHVRSIAKTMPSSVSEGLEDLRDR